MNIPAWHSSPNRFWRFNTDLEGAHFGTQEQANNLRKPGKRPARQYLLNIKNPLRVRDMGTWTLDGIATELLRNDIITQEDYDAIRAEYNWTDERGFAKLKAVLSDIGYDGFVYKNEQEGEGDSYVAFHSNQIKPYKVVEALIKSAKKSEPWNSTNGIYASFSKGFDKPEYYVKCSRCRYVHGTYKTPREAILKKLCPLCSARDIEKLKKEVRMTESEFLVLRLLT